MAMEKHFIQEGKMRSEMDSFLRKEFGRAGYCGMNIQKTPLAVRINLYVEKPPLVIGKKGRRISKLTRTLEEKYSIENLAIDVQRIENPVLNAEIIARRIATALERQMYRRRVVYKAIKAVMSAGARGVEISLSGKIVGKGGRSRTEKYSEGYMKKAGDSTKLVRIGSTQAYLKAGVIGVTARIVPPDAVFPDQITVVNRAEAEEEKKGSEEPTVEESGAVKQPAVEKKSEKKPAVEKKSEKKPAVEKKAVKKAVKKSEKKPAVEKKAVEKKAVEKKAVKKAVKAELAVKKESAVEKKAAVKAELAVKKESAVEKKAAVKAELAVKKESAVEKKAVKKRPAVEESGAGVGVKSEKKKKAEMNEKK